jgi:IS5 family transposase
VEPDAISHQPFRKHATTHDHHTFVSTNLHCCVHLEFNVEFTKKDNRKRDNGLPARNAFSPNLKTSSRAARRFQKFSYSLTFRTNQPTKTNQNQPNNNNNNIVTCKRRASTSNSAASPHNVVARPTSVSAGGGVRAAPKRAASRHCRCRIAFRHRASISRRQNSARYAPLSRWRSAARNAPYVEVWFGLLAC